MAINTKKAEFPLKKVDELLPVIMGAKIFVIADIETTGFGSFDDIIEIGAVKLDTGTKKIVGQFSTYCKMKNHKRIPPEITELTTIRTEDLDGAPNVETALSKFKSFVGTTPLVFHNAAFDWRMLNTKYKLLGTKLNNECICTRRLFEYLHPEVEGSNLEIVTSYYGSPIEGHHRAYVDCKWTAAAFCRMRQEVIEQGLPLNMDSQASLFTPPTPVKVLTADDLNKHCIIQKISGWKKGKIRRIYCTTSVADFFYDIVNHVWNVVRNKTDYDLDIDILAKFILGRLGLNLGEFQERYAPE